MIEATARLWSWAARVFVVIALFVLSPTQWAYAYEPFGLPRAETDVTGSGPENPLRFAGQYRDAASGLDHLRAREYDPAIGRFLSVDPVAPPLEDGYESPYLYAGDQPTLFVDPSGLSRCGLLSSVCAAASRASTRARPYAGVAARLGYQLTAAPFVNCARGSALGCGEAALSALTLGAGGVALRTVELGALRLARAKLSSRVLEHAAARTAAASRTLEAFRATAPLAGARLRASATTLSSRAPAALPRLANREGGSPSVSALRLGRRSPPQPTVAAKAGPGARPTFVASENGVVVPTSRARLEGGFQSAGFPSRPTSGAAGREYTLPDGSLVRIMEPSGQAPLRASFTNSSGGPINPFTGLPVQPPPGLSSAQRLAYVRARTHVELFP